MYSHIILVIECIRAEFSQSFLWDSHDLVMQEQNWLLIYIYYYIDLWLGAGRQRLGLRMGLPFLKPFCWQRNHGNNTSVLDSVESISISPKMIKFYADVYGHLVLIGLVRSFSYKMHCDDNVNGFSKEVSFERVYQWSSLSTRVLNLESIFTACSQVEWRG